MFEQDPRIIGKTLFNYYKIRYLIIYDEDYLTEEEGRHLNRCLELLRQIGVREVSNDWGGQILEVDQPKRKEMFLEPGENWRFKSNLFYNSMTVKIANPGIEAKNARLEFVSYLEKQEPKKILKVYYKNNLVGSFSLSGGKKRFRTGFFSVPVGGVEIKFACGTNSSQNMFFLNNISLRERGS